MIYTAHGEPASPELEARVKALDPSLGLRFCGTYWAVTWTWPQADSRRQMIRDGTMSPDAAFDMIAQLPRDCPPEQAEGYITRSCKVWAMNGRSDIERLLSHIQDHNAKQAAKNLAPLKEYTEELVSANERTLWRDIPGLEHKNVVKVFQSEPTSGKGKKRVKHSLSTPLE